jgi:signal transduction histidine kinase
LLLLSKIENENYDEKQTISINEIIEKQLDFFIGQAQSKNIRIQTDFSELLFVQANQSLTEILISNLFLNAIRHNVKNGQLLIKTSKDSLIFSNTGNAQALNKEKLFTRFSKLNPSAQGNGLGLAIVKKIADLNHWEIKYSFSENKHVFSVRC